MRRAWTSELALIDSLVPALMHEMQPVLGQQILRRDLQAGTRSPEAFALCGFHGRPLHFHAQAVLRPSEQFLAAHRSKFVG